MVKVRLALSLIIALLGVVIIVRSTMVVLEKGLELSVLWQPLILGSLMIVFGIYQWRSWRAKG